MGYCFFRDVFIIIFGVTYRYLSYFFNIFFGDKVKKDKPDSVYSPQHCNVVDLPFFNALWLSEKALF